MVIWDFHVDLVLCFSPGTLAGITQVFLVRCQQWRHGLNILLPPLLLTQLQEVDVCSSCCKQVNMCLFTRSYRWSNGLLRGVCKSPFDQLCRCVVPDAVASIVFEPNQDLWTSIKLKFQRWQKQLHLPADQSPHTPTPTPPCSIAAEV